MLRFGMTLKPDMSPERLIALTRQAEGAGFTHGWLLDSHVLWLEPYPLLTLMATNTRRMRLGTCVTNPAVRDPTVTASALATLNLISGGRMDLGIGRGDSSRRVMGKHPTTLAEMELAIQRIRALAAGQAVEVDGEPLQMTWASGDLPVWVAGYGPKALHLTGRIADGTIIDTSNDDSGTVTQIFYSYTISGVEYESSQSIDEEQRGRPEDYSPGARVTVRYDPRQPGNSVVA